MIIAHCRSSKSLFVHIRFQLPKRSHQHVEPEVEFLATDEHGIIDILGDHIGVIDVKIFKSSIKISSRDYFLKLVYFFKQEDALSLRFVVEFDDPSCIRVFLKFLGENRVLVWKFVCGKKEVQLSNAPSLIFR